MPDTSADTYIEAIFCREEVLLETVRSEVRRRGLPPISLQPQAAQLVAWLVRWQAPRRALEIGGLGGLSAVCISRNLPPGATLLSLEINPEYIAVARETLRQAGLLDRVSHRQGPALESLQQLQQDGARFGFFLIDADKENYPAYLEAVLPLAEPGALIVADNTLFHGVVADPARRTDAAAQALHTFNRMLANHPHLDAVLLPLADGVSVARYLPI